ncbi:restriction endonuclease subunit S [Leuconostoc suionicum]|uniref:restriction endonuclease subunit S n=2 Tax=Leuconostoc suionicum TaxID=1511761 RepID=UPI0024ACBBCA|nr:restriction endonuclease subunit S [Leuconostoc suionicum]MDI6498838.1 restriction endonuclease subunit S [Leuconostoc suionicum]
MSKMAPQIRFQGFTDDWEERKLSDIGDIVTGNTPKTSNSLYYNGSFLFVSPADIQETRYIYKTNTTLTAAGFNTGRLVKTGSTLFVSIGSTIGKVAQASTDVITNQQINSIVPFKHYDNNFIYTSLVNIAKKIKTLAVTQAVPIINKTEFSKNIIYVPDLQEQQKIGLFFKQLDDTIALHQRMLDLLKEQKKGFLQKMFPKNGAKVPELRFSGFADDWEERKLGELANIVGGGTPSTSNPEYWDGDIDWYAPAEIGEQSYVSKSKKTITELGLKKSSARILPVGSVLFTSRAGIGNTAILGKEATTNQGFQSIVPEQNKLDSYFIYSRTNELKRYGEVTGAGSTFVEVSGKQMSKMSIMVPELSEQQQIGSFFNQLDNTIALHQRMLDLLKEQKKGFLQKMFVS